MAIKPDQFTTVQMVKDRPSLHRWVGHLLRSKLGRDADDSAIVLLRRLLMNDEAREDLKTLIEETETRKEQP